MLLGKFWKCVFKKLFLRLEKSVLGPFALAIAVIFVMKTSTNCWKIVIKVSKIVEQIFSGDKWMTVN